MEKFFLLRIKKNNQKNILFYILVFFLFNVSNFAQNLGAKIPDQTNIGVVKTIVPAVLTWDGEVGCRIYESDNKIDFFEQIDESDKCLRFCSNKMMSFTLTGEYISTVEWTVFGGDFVGVRNNSQAQVKWGNPGAGSIKAVIKKLNGEIQIIEYCIDIIPSPIASFLLNNNKEFETCKDSEVYFVNNSLTNSGSAIVSYQWDFGDGFFSNEFEPTHTYTEEGTFAVKLIVTNECNCSDEIVYEISVLDKKAVVITCPTVVCDKALATYTSNDDCKGKWDVIGGRIINNNGNSIDVLWDNVDESGFGYISYFSGCSCPFPTTVKVPVIKANGVIQGKDTICIDEQTRYSLPQWPTTDFNWEITNLDGTYQYSVIETDQRNEIVIGNLPSGEYILKCFYFNTLLECGGFAYKNIRVTNQLIVSPSTDQFICVGDSLIFTSNSSNTSYTLRDRNSIIQPSVVAGQSYIFNNAGTYTLTANAEGFCASDPVYIKVSEKPTVPSGIIKVQKNLCKNMVYSASYQDEDISEFDLVWSISDGGSFVGSNIGQNVSFKFSSLGNKTIGVKKRSKMSPYCESIEELLISIRVISQVDIEIHSVSLQNEFCASSTADFFASLNVDVNEVDYLEWSFVDELGEPSAIGNIIGGQNTLNPIVSFNQLSNSTLRSSGRLKLKVLKCGVYFERFYPITVLNQVEVNEVIVPESVCADTEFDLIIRTSFPISNGILKVDFGNNIVNTIPYNGGLTNEILFRTLNGFSRSLEGTLGTIKITFFSENCENLIFEQTSRIRVIPTAIVEITSDLVFNFCANSIYSQVVTAQVFSDLSGITARWYKVSDPNGEFSFEFDNQTGISSFEINNTMGPGEYIFEVTNSSGCINRSSVYIRELECSSGSDPISCEDLENLEIISSEWISCYLFRISGRYSTNTGGLQLIGRITDSDCSLIENSTSVEGNWVNFEMVFKTNVVGKHNITIMVSYSSGACGQIQTIVLTKSCEPNFVYSVQCQDGVYQINVIDNSSYDYLNLGSILPDINFSITNNLTTYYHNSRTPFIVQDLPPGNYRIKMVLASNNDEPNCEKIVDVFLPDLSELLGDVNFKLENEIVTEICNSDAVTLVPPVNNSSYQYTWEFNGVINTEVSPIISFTNVYGEQNIKLTIKTLEGCVFEYSKILIVNNNNQNVIISGDSQFCSNGSGILRIESTNTEQFTYQWMRNNEEIPGANSLTYQPTLSGIYWVKSINAKGCVNITGSNFINVEISNAPYALIVGTNKACVNERFQLTARVESSQIETRWLRNNVVIFDWSSSILTRSFSEANPGVYVYTLETRNRNNIACVGKSTHTVEVKSIPSITNVSYEIIKCNPFTVELSVIGTASDYVWSNGATGSSIIIHDGGAYKVTGINGVSCNVSAQINVPKSPDSYIWIFPTGCFNYCYSKESSGITILGPSPNVKFNEYHWSLLNENTNEFNSILNGDGIVESLSGILDGTYNLSLRTDICEVTSKELNINYEGECTECKFEISTKPEYFVVTPIALIDFNFSFNNTMGEIITLSLESDFGVFSPSSFILSPGELLDGSTIRFYPYSIPFVVGEYLLLKAVIKNSNGILCEKDLSWYLPYSEFNIRAQEKTSPLQVESLDFVLAPNPAGAFTSISYELPSDEKHRIEIGIYNMLGVNMWKSIENLNSNILEVNVNHYPPGNYLVVMQIDGTLSKQKILIKK